MLFVQINTFTRYTYLHDASRYKYSEVLHGEFFAEKLTSSPIKLIRTKYILTLFLTDIKDCVKRVHVN